MAHFSGAGIDLPFSACGDLSAVQYRFVRAAGTPPRVQQANGASNPYAIGVLQNDPTSLEAANVRVAGTTQLYIDTGASQIVYGGLLSCGSTGLGVPQGATSSSAAAVAMALEAVSAAGSGVLIEVLLLGTLGVKLAAS